MVVQFLFSALLFIQPASARTIDGVHLTQMDIEHRDGLMETFRAHFDPAAIAATEAHMEDEHARGECLTGLVKDLKDSWHLFDADERAEMTAKLAPWKNDLLDSMVPAYGSSSEAPAGPTPPGSCWGTQKDNVITTEHFSVQWDDGVISEAQAEAFADSLEYSYEIEMNELGWRPPEGISSYQLLVMVDSGGSAGAYTTVESCGGRYLPYVVAYAGSFSAGNWYKTMACHELHHAVQFGYGYAHEFWYWEASATWVEDLVYPDLNDWLSAISVYSQVPYIGMNASGRSDQTLFWHTYAMGIWGMFLDQHVGGNELVRDTWEVSQMTNCQYCLWMPDAVDRTGVDFAEVYAEFMATNAVMDYRDSLWIRTPELSDDVSTLPASGESDYRDRPQSLGQNFIQFDSSLGGSGKALEVTFDGENDVDYWVAVLVRGDNTVEEMVEFELNDNMWGVATIDFPGDSSIHLVVSPVDGDAQGYYYDWTSADDYDYNWSAQIVESQTPDDDDDDGNGGSDGDGNAGDVAQGDNSGEVIGQKGSGCACSSTTAQAPGWLVLMLGFLPLVRRRA